MENKEFVLSFVLFFVKVRGGQKVRCLLFCTLKCSYDEISLLYFVILTGVCYCLFLLANFLINIYTMTTLFSTFSPRFLFTCTHL